MRTLTDHIVEGDSANHQLTIRPADNVAKDGAHHRYEISGFNASTNQSNDTPEFSGPNLMTILLQRGPIKEVGVNGVTHESLLAIIIDRLRCYQAGPYACDANHEALQHAEACLHHLQTRTRERIKRGVEGTHVK